MKVRDLRKSKDMTQAELGDMLGLDTNTISGYETGIRTPAWPIIRKIASIFEVPTDELEFGEQLVESDEPSTA